MDDLERLDAKLAENDAQGTPDSEWRAADALFDKASLIYDREGGDEALSLYLEVADRLEHRAEPGPLALRLSALHAAAMIHCNEGRGDASRALAASVVERELDNASGVAAEPLTWIVALLARLSWDAGDRDRPIELHERLMAQFCDVPAAWVDSAMRVARYLEWSGRREQAIRQLDEVVDRLAGASDPELRRRCEDAQAGRAYLAAGASDRRFTDRWFAALMDDAAPDMENAEGVYQRDGGDAALPLFLELRDRYADSTDPEERGRYVHAAWSAAYIHDAAGRRADARALAAELVERQFDTDPAVAPKSMARAALLLARLRWEAGDRERAMALHDRVLGRFAHLGIRGHRQVRLAAAVTAASWLSKTGRADEALRRLDEAIAASGDPAGDLDLRQTLVQALYEKIVVLHEASRFADRDAVCRHVLLRFGDSDDAYIADCVSAARTILQEDPPIRVIVKGLARRLDPRRK